MTTEYTPKMTIYVSGAGIITMIKNSVILHAFNDLYGSADKAHVKELTNISKDDLVILLANLRLDCQNIKFVSLVEQIQDLNGLVEFLVSEKEN